MQGATQQCIFACLESDLGGYAPDALIKSIHAKSRLVLAFGKIKPLRC